MNRMAAKKQTLKTKTKKKKWFPLYAPTIFGGQLIGETYVESAETVKGKFINANLSTISNDMKKQNITVRLRVNKIVEGKGQTEVIGMQQVQGFVKRLVRRGRTKVDDSFLAKTKDGQVVRIKPLIITNTLCVASTSSQIRMEVRKVLIERVAKLGFVNMVQDILNFKVQKDLKNMLNKIHPIRSVDIRVFNREIVRGTVPEAELTLLPVEEEVEVVEEKKKVKADDDEDVEDLSENDDEEDVEENDDEAKESVEEKATEEDADDDEETTELDDDAKDDEDSEEKKE